MSERTPTRARWLDRFARRRSAALDDVDPDPRTITAILDRIPGVWDDTMAGHDDIKAGRYTRLEDL